VLKHGKFDQGKENLSLFAEWFEVSEGELTGVNYRKM
jgi:hypothetical protein